MNLTAKDESVVFVEHCGVKADATGRRVGRKARRRIRERQADVPMYTKLIEEKDDGEVTEFATKLDRWRMDVGVDGNADPEGNRNQDRDQGREGGTKEVKTETKERKMLKPTEQDDQFLGENSTEPRAQIPRLGRAS